MAWKINKITIENFKFFLKPFELKPEGKHVLMYGENGSGKSSIYWAAYTLFQSCLKEPEDARKYFNSNHPDSLCNLYNTDPNRRSGIEIEFKDEHDVKRSYTDGSWAINTRVDDFMRLSTFASDFMNYKFLAAIFDFKNSMRVDLFKIFEDEIFPFLSLNGQVYSIENGESLGKSGVEDWWQYIQLCYETSGMLTRRSVGGVFVHDDRYNTYQNLINDFNNNLRLLLTNIADDANNKLEEAKMPVKISLHLESAAFDKKVEGSLRSYDMKFYPPKIILTAQLLDSQRNPVANKDINHPRSFFNEAKLTKMALAIRLAIFDRKYQNTDCAKVIFVDDLLISLDMSNRLLVVKQLLDYVDRYQLFIFTHDRSFYDLICDSISQRNMAKQWCYYEMYAVDEEVTDDKVPEAILNVKENYLQQAKTFFTKYEYHAAANSLRKECEKQLQRLYPIQMVLDKKDDGTVSLQTLNCLIQKLNDFYRRFALDHVPTPLIDQYRKRILNPLSHNDNKAKIFRSELKMALEEISEFEKIKKLTIVGENEIETQEFVLEVDHEGRHVVVEFTPVEQWCKLIYNGQEYYEGIDIKVTNITGYHANTEGENIRKLWMSICKYSAYAEGAFPALETVIRDKATEVLLKDLPAE